MGQLQALSKPDAGCLCRLSTSFLLKANTHKLLTINFEIDIGNSALALLAVQGRLTAEGHILLQGCSYNSNLTYALQACVLLCHCYDAAL